MQLWAICRQTTEPAQVKGLLVPAVANDREREHCLKARDKNGPQEKMMKPIFGREAFAISCSKRNTRGIEAIPAPLLPYHPAL
jgi:hypothetical protein